MKRDKTEDGSESVNFGTTLPDAFLHRVPRRFLLLLLALIVPLRAAAAVTPGDFVSNFRLTDHLGATHELYYESVAKAVVLVFTSTGSARAGQTTAALSALRTRFAAADVVIWQIDSDLGADRATIGAEQALFNNATPVLVDDAQLVATEYGATRQLETFIIRTATLTLAYHGPLDNANPATLAAPSQNYAADAVATVLAGGDVATPQVALPAAAPALDFPSPPTPDYAADVAPIVLHSCVQCHSTGNIAPFVYANYGDVQSHAALIRSDLLAKRMTPWHADTHYGVFSNSTALTPAQIATLFAWCAAGAPRGTAPDPLVSAPAVPGGDWPLGPPDLIVSIPKQSLPATGIIDYRYLTVAVPVTADTWLRAAVVKPGNTANVHHALVFEGTLADVINLGGGLGGFFAGYVPGLQQTWFPDGSGKLIHKGEQVTFQMHYVTTGLAATDQTQIGFYFAASPPDRELQTKSAYTTAISIPPGAPLYESEATFTPSTTKDVLLYELNPHMHLRGKTFKYEALYPDGTSEVLLNVPQYDFHWQSEYRLTQPKRLPAGTVIRVRGAHDNSAQNSENPDPSARVIFGDQTSDEMFIGFINYAELPDRAAAPPAFSANLVARARVGVPFRLALKAANTVTGYRVAALPAGLTLDAATGVISGTPAVAGRSAIVVYADNAAGSAAAVVDLAVTESLALPAIATQPVSQTVSSGATVAFNAATSGSPTPSYQWQLNGTNIPGATNATLLIAGATAANAGTYTCVATNSSGSVTSNGAKLAFTTTTNPGRLINLSVLATAGGGVPLTVGFVNGGIGTNGSQTLLIRAAGPSLATFNLSNVLSDPTVAVIKSGGPAVGANDNWGAPTSNQGLVAAANAMTGAFSFSSPASLDAALVSSLNAGGYTVQVSGNGTASGRVLAEVYDATPIYSLTTPRLVNVSCLTTVLRGGSLTVGFVLGGTTSKTVLIRATGPTLAAAPFSVPGMLPDPQVTLHTTVNGRDTILVSNAGWGGDPQIATVSNSVGAFALVSPTSLDSVVLTTLPPGSYTAVATSSSNTAGLALIEVYEVP